MSSSVFYRFKSQNEPSRVTFDGTGISVFELKREIILRSNLGDGTDFELIISSEDAGEEYNDDTTIVPRSTTVIARRLPAARPGRGGAARYVSGKMPVNARNTQRLEDRPGNAAKPASSGQQFSALQGALTEEEKIAATLQMGADDWAQQQRQMANAVPVYRSGPAKGKMQPVPDHPPPTGYICYRCGEKGHWIMQCPTNNDPTFDGRPRIKRTTGIPKSFLKTVEKPTTTVSDDATEETKQPSGVMVNAEGEWVVAQPDQATWDRYQSQAKTATTEKQDASSTDAEIIKRGLQCSIDKHLFIDPTLTPCCQSTFCHECIQNFLLENDLRCPQCSTPDIPIDDLKPDEETAKKVRQYEENIAALKKQEKEQKEAKSPKQETVDATQMKRSQFTEQTGAKDSSTSVDGKKTSRKRAASELSEQSQKSKERKIDAKDGILENSSESDPQAKAEADDDKAQLGAAPMTTEPSDSSAKPTELKGAEQTPMQMPTQLPMNVPMNNAFNMFNPMMMPGNMFGNNQNWNHAWPMGFFPGQGFGGMNPQGNGSGPFPFLMGPNQGLQGQGNNYQFANQQTVDNETDSAYMRRPVNPNRQYNRRNMNQHRPAEYREI